MDILKFYNAIEKGKIEVFHRYIRDPNFDPAMNENLALIQACRFQRSYFVECLLKFNTVKNEIKRDPGLIIFYAIGGKDQDIMRKLLDNQDIFRYLISHYATIMVPLVEDPCSHDAGVWFDKEVTKKLQGYLVDHERHCKRRRPHEWLELPPQKWQCLDDESDSEQAMDIENSSEQNKMDMSL